MEDPIVPLERNSVWSSTLRTEMGKTIRENYFGTRMGKVPNWERLFGNRQKGLFLSVYVDDLKLAGKKQKHRSYVESIDETR